MSDSPEDATTPAPPQISWRKLAWGCGFFVALTTLTLWWVVRQSPAPWQSPPVADLRWPFLLAMICLIPVEPLAGGGRVWIIGRTLGTPIPFRTCVISELANIGMAMLTPFLSGGGAGQVYILYRAGVKLSVAFSISVIAFYGSMVTLLIMAGFATLTSGAECGAVLFKGLVGILSAVAALSILGVFWPQSLIKGLGHLSRFHARARGREVAKEGMGPIARRAASGILDYREQMLAFTRRGSAAAVGVIALTMAFMLARATLAFCAIRFLGIMASDFLTVVAAQIKLIVAGTALPTHGGAGIEALSGCFMPDIVPPAITLAYLLIWRASTLYVAGFLGLAALAISFSRNQHESEVL